MQHTQAVPLHLTSLAILAPNNSPLYVHSFTGADDDLRAYHLAHGAVDVIEERIVMTSGPNRPADSYLGLLFCMEDQAFYGFQTPTKLRMVLSVALVDAAVKDSDVVAIFRAVHQLLLRAVNNPFLSLPSSFTAKPAKSAGSASSDTVGRGEGDIPEGGEKEKANGAGEEQGQDPVASAADGVGALRLRNEPVPDDRMFRAGPEDIKPEWLRSRVFTAGIERLGNLLSGPRG